MSKISLIRPLDLATFGVPIVAVSALTTYAYLQGTTGEALAMLVVLTVCFVGIYVAFLVWKYKFLSTIYFTTKHGLHVINNEFVVSKAKIEEITEDTILEWAAVIEKLEKASPGSWVQRCRKCIDGLFVSFEPFPIIHSSMGKLAGYAVGDNVVVGYKEDLDRTALAHELGHYMHKEKMGYFDNEMEHDFIRIYGLK